MWLLTIDGVRDRFDVNDGLPDELLTIIAEAGLDLKPETWTPTEFYRLAGRSSAALHVASCASISGRAVDAVGVTLADAHQHRLHYQCTANSLMTNPDRDRAFAMVDVALAVGDLQRLLREDQPMPAEHATLATRVATAGFADQVRLVDGTADRVDDMRRALRGLAHRWAAAAPHRLLVPFVASTLAFPRASLPLLQVPLTCAGRIARPAWEVWAEMMSVGARSSARPRARRAMQKATSALAGKVEQVPVLDADAVGACLDSWAAALDDACQVALTEGQVLLAMAWRPTGSADARAQRLLNTFPSKADPDRGTGVVCCPVVVADWYALEVGTVDRGDTTVVWLDELTEQAPEALLELFIGMWKQNDSGPLANPWQAFHAARLLLPQRTPTFA